MSNKEINDILNFNNEVKPQHKIDDTPAAEDLIKTLAVEKKKKSPPSVKNYHTFPINLNKTLDIDLQVHMAMTGTTLVKITNGCLRDYFEQTEKPALINEYGADLSGTKRRGINIENELFKKLEVEAAEQDLTMRFIVESLLSKYMKNNKI